MDALLGQLFEGLSPVVLALYRDQTGIAEKQWRLDMLVTKIRSVLEVSEENKIQSESLRKWQQMFKDAANQGDEVRRKLQNQLNSSSSSSSSGGSYSFLERINSRREDMKKLNDTIELLEQYSAQVNDFLKTVKLELSELGNKAEREASLGNCLPPTGLTNLAVMGIKTAHSDPDLWPKENSSVVFEVGNKRERASPERLGTHTCSELRKRLKKGERICRSAARSRRVSDQSEKVESKGPKYAQQEVEEPKNMVESKEDPKPKNMVEYADIMEYPLLNSFSFRAIADVAAVEGLVARIQGSVDMAMDHGAVEDGSSFGLWIAKLRKAIEEGNCVASAIKSNKYRPHHDKILDEEVGVILSAVHLRLQTVVSDLENFLNLAEVQELARELTPRSSNANEE